MKERYLEVTFRKGKPLAAYLYLPRGQGEKSCRTEKIAPAILVDFGQSGKPISIEITTPSLVTLEQVNQALTGLGLPEIGADEWSPLMAA